MKWIKFSLETTTDAVDLLSYELNAIGVEGIEIEDKLPLTEEEKKQMFVDILPDPEDNDGSAFIHFYMEPDCNLEEIMSKIQTIFSEISAYCKIGKGTIRISETEDKDWMNNWKQFFKPFRAAKDLIIKPTWEDYMAKDASEIVIEIDPGIAFGTGSHETTRLCIQALRKYIPDHPNKSLKLLDVGCGSGILSIAGIKLGAKGATAIDMDESAVRTTAENRTANQIPEQQIRILPGNLIDDKRLQEEIGFGCYHIVVANILADVIIPLSEIIRPHMAENALFITSGIIHTKEDEVRLALVSNGFQILEVNTLKEWVCFIAQ